MRFADAKKLADEIAKMLGRKKSASDLSLLAMLAPEKAPQIAKDLMAANAAVKTNRDLLTQFEAPINDAAKQILGAVKKELQTIENKRMLDKDIAVFLLVA